MNLNRDVSCGGKRSLTVLPTICEEVEGADVETSVIEVSTEEVTANLNDVATKNDDAKVQVQLWDRKVKEGMRGIVDEKELAKALSIVRKYLLRSWKLRVWRSYLQWETNEGVRGQVVDCGTTDDAWDCISRCFRATWWNWDNGSRPFFWRWPRDYRDVIQNGMY